MLVLDLFKVLLMCLIQFSLESKIESYNIHCKFAFTFYVIHGYFDWGALFCETDITPFFDLLTLSPESFCDHFKTSLWVINESN